MNKGREKQNARAPKYLPCKVKFGAFLDRFYEEVSDMQLKDRELWRLTVRPFIKKSDARDGGWRCEYWGKLMRGGCMVYEYSGDAELYSVLREAVELLLGAAEPNGRISTYPADTEFTGWDMWGRKYVMLGLEHFIAICPEEKFRARVLEALEAHARVIMARVGEGEGKIPVLSTSRIWGGINSLSIIQPFVRLYTLTGDGDYFDYAKALISTHFAEKGIFALARADECAPCEYPVTKAYETISCFEGLLECYEAGGDAEYLEIAEKFAKKVLATDFTIVGGSGCRDEYFDGSTKKQVVWSDIHKQETCVTVTLMKFLAALWRNTGDAALIGAIERAFLNLYLGAFNDEPNRGNRPQSVYYSYSPVCRNPRWTLMGGEKDLSNYASYGCCIAIGAAGFGTIPKVAASASDGALSLNLYFDGEYSSGNAAFTVCGNYPEEGKIAVRFLRADGEKFSVRRPDWAGEKIAAKKGGKKIEPAEKDGYLDFGAVTSGDEIEIDFGMRMRCVRSETVNEEVSGLVAFERGPIVYCAAEPETDVDRAYDFVFKADGEPEARRVGDGCYSFALADGGEAILRAYRTAGRDIYEPKRVSAWLGTAEK